MATPSPSQRILGYQNAVAQIRARLEQYARLSWRGLPGYRDSDIDAFVDRMVPRVLAGQRQIALLTDSYLAALARQRPGAIDADLISGAAVRGGVDPAVVYRRPAITLYRALAAGKAFDLAVQQGARRLSSLVTTDLQLAKRQQQDLTLTSSGVRSYRRVLTGGEDCALCSIASDQVYRTGDLLPIHPGCDCDVAPDDEYVAAINTSRSRGPVASVELTERGYDAEDTDPGVVAVREHGEYGPTLAWARDRFTGPGDL